METWDLHHRNERRKSLGFTSGIIHFMDLGQRYLGSKGVPEHKVEDGALGNLAPPADREESAWHHNSDLEQVMHANLHAKRGRDPTEGYGERARDSVKIIVILSKETSSPSQIH